MDKKAKSIKHINVKTSDDIIKNISIEKGSLTEDLSNQKVADYIPPIADDPKINKAIDDIVVSESNEILAVEDMFNSSRERTKKKRRSISKIFKNKWFYIVLAIIIFAIFIIPYSRYSILGLVIKEKYPITIIDSVTNQPVSQAEVKIDGQLASTDASGQVTMNLPVGKYKYQIIKKYYRPSIGYIFVGLLKNPMKKIELRATGRPVSITVINKLNGSKLSNVHISVTNTSAITNSNGQADIVLPTQRKPYQATFNDNGFNTLTTLIDANSSAKNYIIQMVPSGHIYYLNDANGTINVIKSNLDGSNPSVELAGTGLESASTSILKPSPDWKYLVLEAQRSGSQPELYLINTSTNKVKEFDSSLDSFSLIGWNGDQFIYDRIATSDSTTTAGREQLVAYNAVNGQQTILAQNQTVGTSPNYAYQSFSSFEIMSGNLVYSSSWNQVGSYNLSSQVDNISGINLSTLNGTVYGTFNAATTGIIEAVKNRPNNLYLTVSNTSTNQNSYYQFNGSSLSAANAENTVFPKYYLSPSGNQSLWSIDNSNGQLVVYIADQSGQNSKELPLLTGYNAHGWYNDTYILIDKNNQLYIAPSSISKSPTLIGQYLPSS